MSLYRKIKLVLQFREKLCGGIPKTKKLIEGWLAAQKPPLTDLSAPTAAEMGCDLMEMEERAWTGFKFDPVIGYYVESRQIKAMLKESANVTGVTMKLKGSKNFITNGIFIKPDKIPLGILQFQGAEIEQDLCQAGKLGFEESVCHISGPAGKRSALKRFDFAWMPRLELELWILNRFDEKEMIPDEVIHMLFEHGQESGFGSNRSQEFGKYDLEEWEPVGE